MDDCIKTLRDAEDFITRLKANSGSDYVVHFETARFEIISLNKFPSLFFLRTNKSGKLSYPSFSIESLKEWIKDIED